MKFKMRPFLFFFGVLVATVASEAYIPPYWMILSRTSTNHGTGLYVIDQDVIFNHGTEPLVVNERWFIRDEQTLRVEVSGRKDLKDRLRMTYVYQNGHRFTVDSNGRRKIERIPNDFIEPYFHFRSSRTFRTTFVTQNMAPSVSLRSEPHKYSAKDPFPEPEAYLRLARSGGVVTYAVGTPSPASSTEGYPGLWIEQDQFVIRKIRLASLVEVSADQYKSYSNGLWLPLNRTVSWRGQNAKIVLNSVRPLQMSSKMKALFEASSLSVKENPDLPQTMPDDAVVREFYSRMR